MRLLLTQIEAWHTRLDALSDEEIEDLSYEDAAADLGQGVAYVGDLLSQLRAASEAIPSSLVPTCDEHGNDLPLVERVRLLALTAEEAIKLYRAGCAVVVAFDAADELNDVTSDCENLRGVLGDALITGEDS